MNTKIDSKIFWNLAKKSVRYSKEKKCYLVNFWEEEASVKYLKPLRMIKV